MEFSVGFRKATPDFLFFRSEDSSFVAGLRLFFTTPYLHKEPEKLDDTIFWFFSAAFAARGCRVV